MFMRQTIRKNLSILMDAKLKMHPKIIMLFGVPGTGLAKISKMREPVYSDPVKATGVLFMILWRFMVKCKYSQMKQKRVMRVKNDGTGGGLLIPSGQKNDCILKNDSLYYILIQR